MTLTVHQAKRIRTAGAIDIARMVHQEKYWSSEALGSILIRIEILSEEQPLEAVTAGRSAIDILDRLSDPEPDLQAFTLGVYGSTLRRADQFSEALATYEQALSIDGVSDSGRSGVLQRIAIVLVYEGNLDRALDIVADALLLMPENITSRSVRGLIKMLAGDLTGSLEDCMAVLREADITTDNRSVISALGSIANVLSYESMVDIDEEVFAGLTDTVALVRKSLPNGGSNYHKAKRPRLLLSRAEAFLLMRSGKTRQATSILRRATDGLEDTYPEDALAASADLVRIYVREGKERLALKECQRTLSLLDREFSVANTTVGGLLKSAVARESLKLTQVVEIRTLLRLLR